MDKKRTLKEFQKSEQMAEVIHLFRSKLRSRTSSAMRIIEFIVTQSQEKPQGPLNFLCYSDVATTGTNELCVF